MAPDSVGDGDQRPRRRRRRLMKSGRRVNPSPLKKKLKVKKDEYARGYRYPPFSVGGKLALSSSEDDDDDYHRKMTRAEMEIYNKQIQETGGFDVVDVPPEVSDCGVIHPYPDFDKDPKKFEEVKRCSRMAIEVYNEKHNAKYEFTRVLKLCSMPLIFYVHYITFEAKAGGAAPVCFQAIVAAGIAGDEKKVLMCRPKP